MDALHQIATLIATVLGTTPDKLVAVLFGAVMAPVTYQVTKQLDIWFAKLGWFAEAETAKIKGTVMVVLSSLVSVGVIFLIGLVFGVDYMSNESLFTGIVGALGVNQTIATFIFHRVKAKNAGRIISV